MKILALLFALGSICFCTMMVSAKMVGPIAMPAERLIKNVESYLQKHPDDPEAFYSLGRIHYMSFTNKIGFASTRSTITDTGHTFPDIVRYPSHAVIALRRTKALEEIPTLGRDATDAQFQAYWKAIGTRIEELEKEGYPPELNTQELLEHASKSVEHFQKAIRLDPDNALYYLSLASLYHQFLEWKATHPTIELPPQLASITLKNTRDIVFMAFDISYQQDYAEAKKTKSVSGMGGIVSNEAGRAYMDWATPEATQSTAEKERFKFIQKHIKRMEKFPMWITPIVFTLDEHESINELLQPTLSVTYDLDGDGSSETWPWLKPSTALLVWDPDGTGHITSGRQLFGSGTWWMMYSDGYKAMAALDDNLDGALSGEELTGIAAWFDHNSDGISQPGEVTPLRELGVASIATSATGETQGMLMNAQGITLEDGQILPSYDWVTTPVDKAIALPLRLY